MNVVSLPEDYETDDSEFLSREYDIFTKLCTLAYTTDDRDELIRTMKFLCGYKRLATYMKLVALLLHKVLQLLDPNSEDISEEEKEVKEVYKSCIGNNDMSGFEFECNGDGVKETSGANEVRENLSDTMVVSDCFNRFLILYELYIGNLIVLIL
jgi:hypothetical protein